MTSLWFIPRIFIAIAAGSVLAFLGALIHQRTLSILGLGTGQEGWRGIGIPYASAFAVLVLVLWIRRMRHVWGVAAAAMLGIAWVCTSLLLASSNSDFFIANNGIGITHISLGSVCALVAISWPVRRIGQ